MVHRFNFSAKVISYTPYVCGSGQAGFWHATCWIELHMQHGSYLCNETAEMQEKMGADDLGQLWMQF